jgi:molybdopterin synthase catalytic subunit
MIKLTEKPIDIGEVIDAVRDDRAGGIDVFVGTVRAQTQGRKVVALEFEVYNRMAESELKRITAEAFQKWPVLKTAVSHAVGRKMIGDIAVAIAVSAAHREAAFDACRYIIDTLKERVPIWKKEIFEDGEVWVAAHP